MHPTAQHQQQQGLEKVIFVHWEKSRSMAQNKTQKNDGDVHAFIAQVLPFDKQQDCMALLALMQDITQATPKMWGSSIIGFGEYRYTYASGRSGDWFLCGFSPRKKALTLYLMCDLSHPNLPFDGLGKYSTGKGCLYVKALEDIDLKVLEKLIRASIKMTQDKYS